MVKKKLKISKNLKKKKKLFNKKFFVLIFVQKTEKKNSVSFAKSGNQSLTRALKLTPFQISGGGTLSVPDEEDGNPRV